MKRLENEIFKIKDEKGSVTLFILVAMLFFVLSLLGIYMSNSSKQNSQLAHIKQIQSGYVATQAMMETEYIRVTIE